MRRWPQLGSGRMAAVLLGIWIVAFGPQCSGVMRVAVCDPGAMSFVYRNEAGDLVGFDIDLWKELHKRLLIEVRSGGNIHGLWEKGNEGQKKARKEGRRG